MKKIIYRPLILLLMLILCSLFYYFGELVDWAAWDSLRNNFFYGIHDVHRLLFLIPIVYAAYIARVKGAIIITLISFLIFLPRAFFISPYPDPLLRMIIFTVFAGVVGYLVARIRNEQAKFRRMEAARTLQRDTMLSVIDNIADGVIITSRDYRIRFMNDRMEKEFGKQAGITCHQLLHQEDSPCHDCKITSVIDNKEIYHWECKLPGGRIYMITAAPYIDDDGTTCQISILKHKVKGEPA